MIQCVDEDGLMRFVVGSVLGNMSVCVTAGICYATNIHIRHLFECSVSGLSLKGMSWYVVI